MNQLYILQGTPIFASTLFQELSNSKSDNCPSGVFDYKINLRHWKYTSGVYLALKKLRFARMKW